MNKRNVWRLVLCLVTVGVLMTACGNQPTEEPTEAPIKLTLALGSPEVWIQPVIAQAEGYFEDVGLDVEIVRFTSGRAAMDALIGGQADIATTAIAPSIFAIFQDQKIAIIAENARYPGEKVTARVESGISTPEDLRGKKIGVTLGSDVHFFLNVFLNYHGMTVEDVELVKLGPSDMVISLVRGDLDAFASWSPQPAKAKEEMGDGAIFLEQPEDPIHEAIYLLATMQGLLEENPEAYVRFMKAMVMADEFVVSNFEDTIQHVADASEIDFELAESLMLGNVYHIWLDKTFISGAEERATWQLEYDLAPEGAAMPEFREFIFPESLLEADPDRVSLD